MIPLISLADGTELDRRLIHDLQLCNMCASLDRCRLLFTVSLVSRLWELDDYRGLGERQGCHACEKGQDCRGEFGSKHRSLWLTDC
jgi:hypothetical protein